MGRQTWEVVGGKETGGIIVRTGFAVASSKADSRLSTGAIVKELQLKEGRLQYARLSGTGPATGWVSVKINDKELLVKSEQKAPKVLCLHGFRTSASIMEEQFYIHTDFGNRLEEAGLDLEFIDAPYRCTPEDEAKIHPDIIEIFGHLGGFYEWYSSSADGSEYARLDESLRYLEKEISKRGPFVGIVGFSQGGTIAHLITYLQAIGAAFTTHPPFQFTVLLNTRRSRATVHQDLWKKSVPSDRLPRPLVIYGGLDTSIPPQQVEELIPTLPSPEVIFLPEQHHAVPLLSDADAAKLVSFVRSSLAASGDTAKATADATMKAEGGGRMRVVVVPVLSDNYSYLLIDEASKKAATVDPAEAHIVLSAARREGVEIVAVLTTHHHYDHAGGNSTMASKVPGLKVYGGRLDNVEACTHPLNHNETFSVGGIRVQALHTPGHTRGSTSFYCTDGTGSPGAVFTGDTLFVGGCGRVFEATPQDLYRSLSEVLGRLPPETKCFPGHEYTIKNLQFAVSVEPGGGNANLEKMLQWAKEQRMAKAFTVPSTLQNEFLINPFLRASDPKMASICPGCSPVDVFTNLRKQKDRF
mmetsp:Transcript_42473/g.77717  ORF Transcript_42473/g.77717 Transcript_42473/m.77717 type:complete len:584 (-) Transcript_42473:18-1769(-)